MAEDKISPEEKLLNLIKGNKTVNEKETEIKLPEKKKRRRILLNRKHLIRLTWPGLKLKPLLMFLIILLFCFIGYESRPGIKIKDNIDSLGQEVRVEKKESREEPVTLKPYSYYLQELGGKSLFSPLVIEKAGGVAVASTERIEDLCKSYQLKGVVLAGERPEAVIEDTQSRRTSTYSIGDNIGKVQIIDIKEGKVTFGYENQTYDLSF